MHGSGEMLLKRAMVPLVFLSMMLVPFLVCRCTGLLSTNIADIKNNSRHYAGREVTVSCEATGTFSLVVIKYYSLRDSTGEITVVTERPLPEGQRLKVRGVVREAFSIGIESPLVIVEEPERAKQSVDITRLGYNRRDIFACRLTRTADVGR